MELDDGLPHNGQGIRAKLWRDAVAKSATKRDEEFARMVLAHPPEEGWNAITTEAGWPTPISNLAVQEYLWPRWKVAAIFSVYGFAVGAVFGFFLSYL